MEKQKRYEAICPECDTKMYVEKSMAQHMGMPDGHGRCIKCNVFLHLVFDSESQTMSAEKWDDFMLRVAKEKREFDKNKENCDEE